MDNEKMLTIAETAKRLRVCQRTVFYYIEQGKLKPVKIGGIKKTGRVYVPKAEIERILKAN